MSKNHRELSRQAGYFSLEGAKRGIAFGLAVASALAVSSTATTAEAVPQSSQVVTLSLLGSSFERISYQDLIEISRRAAVSGDHEVERGARLMAERVASGLNPGSQASSQSSLGIGPWVRKVVVWTLRWAKDKLPARIRPWANKIADLLDAAEAWSRMGLITTFTQAGIPYDVAVAAADWIVFFLI